MLFSWINQMFFA